MKRTIRATLNSARAWRRLARDEAAFRVEVTLLAVAVPVAYLITASWRGFALLIGSLLVVLIVEVLNTGLESACDAITREHDADIGFAKDCGSLAVALSLVLAGGTWALAIGDWLVGPPA